MKNISKQALRVAFYGMNDRSFKTMAMYLRGPCQGAAVVVAGNDAEIDIIDADHPTAREILETCKAQNPVRPIILLSLQPLQIADTLFVQKPVAAVRLLEVFEQAKQTIYAKPPKAVKPVERVSAATGAQDAAAPQAIITKAVAAPLVDNKEQQKTAEHRTAHPVNAGGSTSFLGIVANIDFSDPQQLQQASYTPKGFYLGYVQSALKVTKDKGQVLKLNCGWKPLLIFPQSEEVWLDADDKQLRAFAGIPVSKEDGTTINLSPVNLNTANLNDHLDKLQSMQAFLWKLAILTSKGRYPDTIDINRPVYLKHWPNFTRLLITPHALRIAALLMQGPRSMLNIASVLNIKPQYVFVFVSACHVLNLIDQARRQADEMVAPEKIEKSKKQGLFSKILNKLRGSN